MIYGNQVKVDWFEFCESKKTEGTTEASQSAPATSDTDGFMPTPAGDDLPF